MNERTDALMSILNDFFDLVFCINLDGRPDRWATMCQRFQLSGIQVERFPADSGPPGEPEDNETYRWGHARARIGCAMSHIGVVREAKRRGARSVLVFEDDVIFEEDFETKLRTRLPELPADWDLFYLGGWHPAVTSTREQERIRLPRPEHVSGYLYRLRHDFCLHAYGVRHSIFDQILEIDPRSGEPIDHVFIRRFQSSRRCFGLMTAAEAEPGTWGLVQQDHSLGSDIRKPENLTWVRWKA